MDAAILRTSIASMSLSHFTSPSSSFNFLPPPPPPPRRLLTPRLLAIRCFHSRPSTSTSATTLSNIVNSGVIACLRAESADVAMEAARAAISGGISVVGTIMKTEDAENAKDAGAKFVMSPAIGILDQDNDDFLYIPGVMTPSEILSSYNAGAKIVKVYPVSAVGGVGYIATLKKPFPHIPMVASQGITTDSVGEYIAKGASSVVLSDAIFDKEAMAQRNFSAVYRLAQFAASQGNEAEEKDLCQLISFQHLSFDPDGKLNLMQIHHRKNPSRKVNPTFMEFFKIFHKFFGKFNKI
ncbi:Aldolase-type TIM barrel [Cynara cardunculus var. scolymus]|uniref:Aldolase-type TIM barrel n=1 Tax=Cynara cardunculus var. scolymus TaxID=59895 RepID=A0A103Y6D0_CYNCS|nr:Aldolase-type TIM barrel [Cynara cardunculus var. scolymus]